MVAAHRQHVRPPLLLEPPPQAPVAAVDLVAGDPGRGHPGGERPLQHHAGQPDLGGEGRPLGDARLLAPPRVIGPLLGQVQGPVQERRAVPRGVGQEHADLGVLDPPGRAGVLPRHARRNGSPS